MNKNIIKYGKKSADYCTERRMVGRIFRKNVAFMGFLKYNGINVTLIVEVDAEILAVIEDGRVDGVDGSVGAISESK